EEPWQQNVEVIRPLWRVLSRAAEISNRRRQRGTAPSAATHRGADQAGPRAARTGRGTSRGKPWLHPRGRRDGRTRADVARQHHAYTPLEWSKEELGAFWVGIV